MSHRFTKEEVSQRDGKNGRECWLIIKDSVYNVTGYLKEHPGGDDLILEWGGKDGTRAFNDFGHSSDAVKDLKKFKIGELAEEPKPTAKQSSQSISKENDVKKKKSYSCLLLCR
ncbi:cytochrome b5 [Lutzomyia longipalpis]|uniref:cytochrome b5 n=1 Tax=Lutzomyia longipalpis TaxID=7200 RepID=UPI00248430A4|nr:cytochrome b5 [Lutzomyia longipalpis]